MVTTSKVWGPAWGERQVLRTIVESSFTRVLKLCAGVPSSSVRVLALRLAASERWAGATGIEDPWGRFTFGIYGGDKNQVYRRELY